MEELIVLLRKDIESGFSKSDLERLIGLPKNSLSNVLSGNKLLSQKSILKVQVFMKSEKPNPLDLIVPKKKVVKVTDINQATQELKPESPSGSNKSNHSQFGDRFPGESSIDYRLRMAGVDPSTIKSKLDGQ